MDIIFYFPGRFFPSVSITGSACALKCAHCGGKHLEHMIPLTDADALYDFALDLNSRGGRGFLLSGGCNTDGRIELKGFMEVLKKIKAVTDLKINAHTGLVDQDTAKGLAETGIDVVSFDVVGSDKVLRDIYHLDKTTEDIEASLKLLADSHTKEVVPHICIGLEGEDTAGEFKALDMCSIVDLRKIVLLCFMPTRDTAMHGNPPPSKDHIINVLSKAKRRYRSASILLGCMRPRGNPSLEIETIKHGIDGIVLPSSKTMEYAVENNLNIIKREFCCALQT